MVDEMNLYMLINEELTRMHRERDAWLVIINSSPREQNFDQLNGYGTGYIGQTAQRRYDEINRQIYSIREKLLSALEQHDARVQEKVAELALTGITE